MEEKFQQALKLHQDAQFPQAESLYNEILIADPDHLVSHQNLVDILLRLPDLPKALEHGQRVVELAPDYSDGHYNLAVLYYRTGQFSEAISAFETLLSMEPETADAYYHIGNIHYQQGDLPAAIAAYEKTLAIQPQSIPAWLNLGSIRSEQGDWEAGLKAYEQAEAADPVHAMTQKFKGIVLHTLSRFEEAEAAYLKALPELENDPEIHVYLGNVVREQVRLDEAAGYFQAALRLDPQHKVALENLRLLQGAKIQSWHLDMLADTARNQAFDAALRKAIQPGQIVLDIGTGSGLLAMMAARAGAAHVLACEMLPVLAESAQEIIRQNGFENQITVLPIKSSQIDPVKELPEKADILVTEILDVGLLGEAVLPTLRHALKNLLKPAAKLIPARAKIWGQLIECEHERKISPLKSISGFDFSYFEKFRPVGKYKHVFLSRLPHKTLSDPFPVFEIDFADLPPFATPTEPNVHELSVLITNPGLFQGLVFWFELWLDENIMLSSGPEGEMIHWGQALFMMAEDRVATPGKTMKLRALQSEMLIAFENLD